MVQNPTQLLINEVFSILSHVNKKLSLLKTFFKTKDFGHFRIKIIALPLLSGPDKIFLIISW